MTTSHDLDYLKSLNIDTIYTSVVHTSQSGMMREIKFYTITEQKFIDWRPSKMVLTNITWYIWSVLGYTRWKNYWLKVKWCGMDMAFSIVYALSEELHKGKDRAGYIINQQAI